MSKASPYGFFGSNRGNTTIINNNIGEDCDCDYCPDTPTVVDSNWYVAYVGFMSEIPTTQQEIKTNLTYAVGPYKEVSAIEEAAEPSYLIIVVPQYIGAINEVKVNNQVVNIGRNNIVLNITKNDISEEMLYYIYYSSSQYQQGEYMINWK